jgi:myo-inositol-1(or 4)-monophosphatase
MYEKELAVAKEAALEAGKVLKECYGKESFQELVTDADMKANEIIINKISSAFPTHSIFSEESAGRKKKSEFEWFIDPLDGTTNFVTQIPFFCTALGLLKKGEPVVGVVYNPIACELFYASLGSGAFMNGKRIFVSKNQDIRKTLINFCHKNKKEDVERIGKAWVELKHMSRAAEMMHILATARFLTSHPRLP